MSGLAAKAQAMDDTDPLAHFRDRFHLRDGLVYLDGNSLGCLPKSAPDAVGKTVEREWGEGLITSWLDASWSTAPQRIGDKIAKLVGAKPGEVIATDSTSINLFKALTAALSLQPDRTKILTETTNFPTDSYMMQGIEAFSGGRIKYVAVAPDDVLDAVDDDTAAVLLTHVHYRTASARDIAVTTKAIQASGAMAIWDLSHSTGAVEIDLTNANVDFAVGCGYKYLNGGPGAPAFFYAPKRNHGAQSVLSGWFGHARPFDFEESYQPANGIERFLCGTPPILGLAGLDAGVDLILEADMRQIRAKSVAMAELMTAAMVPLCSEYGFAGVSPDDPAQRGSHLAYVHEHAYQIVQALREVDVIADFRTPDVIRFGLTPMYSSYSDMVEAVSRLEQVCSTRSWDKPEYHTRAAVT
jgi:kynureninase